MTTTFLLAGNGSFVNRGCEAISRGTIEILKQAFGPSIRIIHASHGNTDSEVTINMGAQDVPFSHKFSKYSKKWIEFQLNRFVGTNFKGGFAHLEHAISQADIVLCIGGDNYSLDYGYPEPFVQFDRLVLKHQKPIVYFGVSVGPFSADIAYEQKMKSHLDRISTIFARESATTAYLSSIGIKNNVHLIADPAFAMKPVQPETDKFVLNSSDFIGVNFSTTVGRMTLDAKGESTIPEKQSSFASSGQLSNSFAIVKLYADISAELIKGYGKNLVFIPHVVGGSHCDYIFMTQVADQVEEMGHARPIVVPDNLSAPEYKWVISKSRLFIGARTHSTIAAFSTGVPTISLAYSIKAKGLTQDMYGCDDFCIHGSMVNVGSVINATKKILADELPFRNMLTEKAKIMSEKALYAGEIIKKDILKLS